MAKKSAQKIKNKSKAAATPNTVTRKSAKGANKASSGSKTAAKKIKPTLKKAASSKAAPDKKSSSAKKAPSAKKTKSTVKPAPKKIKPAAAKKPVTKKASPAPKTTTVKKAATAKKVTSAKKNKTIKKATAAKKAPAKKVQVKKTPAKKTATAKVAAKKAPAKKTGIKKAAAAAKRPAAKLAAKASAPKPPAAKAKPAAVKKAAPVKPSAALAPPAPKRAKPAKPAAPSFDAIKYLEGLERFGIKLGLSRIEKLLNHLGNPQKKLKVIHVVGTNGKSSTARMISAILSAHGTKVGAYLSPHLVFFNERFLINDKEISDLRFEKLILEVKKAAEEVNKRSRSSGPLTQFEILTAAAFLYFHQQKVETAVIEAGLGGRYDATNVIDSKVQVLTNVELEHTDLLGDTVAEIVREKTAVIPDKGNVVLGALSEEALKEAVKICKRKEAAYLTFGEDFSLLKGRGDKFDVWTAKGQYADLALTLFGQYQRTNCAVAIQAAELFMRKALDEKKLRRAIYRIKIPARMEILSEKPLIILDGAHNPSGIDQLLTSLEPISHGRRTICVVSILQDKDAEKMLGRLLEFCDILFITENSNPRCSKAQDLANLPVVTSSSVQTFVARKSQSALESAFKLASIRDVILVTGSLYLLSDIKKRMS